MHTSVENRFSYGLILKSSNALFVHCLARINSHAKRGPGSTRPSRETSGSSRDQFISFLAQKKILKSIVRNDKKKNKKNKKKKQKKQKNKKKNVERFLLTVFFKFSFAHSLFTFCQRLLTSSFKISRVKKIKQNCV